MTNSDRHDDCPKFSDSAAFRAWSLNRLAHVEVEAANDPLTNGVRRFAFELSQHLESGALTINDVEKLGKLISDDAFVARAERFAETHHERPDFSKAVEKAFAPFADKDFDTVRRALETTRAGIVFTAHPTFANSQEMRRAFTAYASRKTDEATFRKSIAGRGHGPDATISLFDEHAEVLGALGRAQDVLRDLSTAIFAWTKSRFPDRWTEISPAPISLATWVGYDLDGRTDIHWSQTFHFRLDEKARQLAAYSERLAALIDCDDDGSDIVAQLRRAADLAASHTELFAVDLEEPENAVRAANALTANHPDKMPTLAPVIDGLNSLIAETADENRKLALCVLRSEMRNYGLGLARIHLRVNAAQVRSTLQQDLGFSPDRAFIDRTALAAAAEIAGGVKSRKINFANVFREKMTARRQLMLCKQFAKHVDADTPIRFLIAECEAPATIMGAVYLARLYEIDHLVDISPLFETPDALESGGRFIERLLDEPEFVKYIRARGRIAIQLGFSDSGRFIGQLSADMAIERLHILLARQLVAHKVTDVEALVFNTHGESMGRGGFPGSLHERFDHLITPWARARFEHDGIALNAESSFQGGDGFMHFQTPTLAAATVSAMFNWAFTPVRKDENDRFYSDINFSWDVFRAIEQWQKDMFEYPSYQSALGSFAPNLLVTTGSRKVRRQSGASKNDAARSLRAIPHNAILQQLAAPANVSGGLGYAAHREPDRFVELVEQSPRMQALIKMGAKARSLTSLSILRSYGSIYDPSFWTIRARHDDTTDLGRRYNRIAQTLNDGLVDVDMNRLANLLSVDRKRYDRLGLDEVVPEANERFSPDLYILHAARMALVMRGVSLTAGVPSFSGRHEITGEALIELALSMRFADVASLIGEIFPLAPREQEALSAIEEAAEPSDQDSGYSEIQQEFAAPLAKIDATIKELGIGIAHFYGAYG